MKQECWPKRNFLFGKGSFYTNLSMKTRLFLIFCQVIIVLVSPVYTECEEGKKMLFTLLPGTISRPQVSISSR